MGTFKSAVITKKGQALMAKVVSGATKLTFTKIAVSESNLGSDLASLTGIGTIKQSQPVASVVRQNETYVKVGASFSNDKLSTGYYVRNIGLYATDSRIFCFLETYSDSEISSLIRMIGSFTIFSLNTFRSFTSVAKHSSII